MGQKQLLPVWEHLKYAWWPRLAIPWKPMHWLVWSCFIKSYTAMWLFKYLTTSRNPGVTLVTCTLWLLDKSMHLPVITNNHFTLRPINWWGRSFTQLNCSLECSASRHCLKDWSWLLQRRSLQDQSQTSKFLGNLCPPPYFYFSC